MKLFTTLFLTIAAQTYAEDDLPNLRGVADIALTNGNGEEFQGSGPGFGAQGCRRKGQFCSSSGTTPPIPIAAVLERERPKPFFATLTPASVVLVLSTASVCLR